MKPFLYLFEKLCKITQNFNLIVSNESLLVQIVKSLLDRLPFESDFSAKKGAIFCPEMKFCIIRALN